MPQPASKYVFFLMNYGAPGNYIEHELKRMTGTDKVLNPQNW